MDARGPARLTPRDVLTPVHMVRAAAIGICHNHPSGLVAPSLADRTVIPTLRDAARLVGITLVDHLIVTPTSHYSFAAEEHWQHADADTPPVRVADMTGPCG